MAQLQRYGPYGDKEAEQNFSLELDVSDKIKAVVVRSGYVVDAIGFVVTDTNGHTETNMYGGKGGHEYMVNLQVGEFITGISGRSKDSFISKMKIHTNLRPRGHGPYGTRELQGGEEFKSPMPLSKDDRIVEFFGTAHDSNLVAIGLSVLKQSQVVEPQRPQTIEKYGPFGYQTGQEWSIMLESGDNFKELIIKIGAVVDSITFVTTRTRRKFGGDGGNTLYTLPLQCGEYITNVSGWIGEWHRNYDLTKLKIHTNMCADGYGPYGGGPYTNYLSQFRSQVPPGGRVVGFFGTIHNNYIESIGLYVKRN